MTSLHRACASPRTMMSSKHLLSSNNETNLCARALFLLSRWRHGVRKNDAACDVRRVRARCSAVRCVLDGIRGRPPIFSRPGALRTLRTRALDPSGRASPSHPPSVIRYGCQSFRASSETRAAGARRPRICHRSRRLNFRHRRRSAAASAAAGIAAGPPPRAAIAADAQQPPENQPSGGERARCCVRCVDLRGFRCWFLYLCGDVSKLGFWYLFRILEICVEIFLKFE